MTKEVKIKRALDLYDSQMERHKIEYKAKFNSLKEAGTGQAGIDELDTWSIHKKNRIRNELVKAVLAAAE